MNLLYEFAVRDQLELCSRTLSRENCIEALDAAASLPLRAALAGYGTGFRQAFISWAEEYALPRLRTTPDDPVHSGHALSGLDLWLIHKALTLGGITETHDSYIVRLDGSGTTPIREIVFLKPDVAALAARIEFKLHRVILPASFFVTAMHHAAVAWVDAT